MTSYLKLTWRHLWRRKLYTTVILLSLTIGFASTNLILSFLIGEVHTDSFHEKKDRIYQVVSDDLFGGSKNTMTYIPGALLPHLKNNYPEVSETCLLSERFRAFLSIDDIDFSNVTIVSADDSFFKLFDFPLNTSSEKSLHLLPLSSQEKRPRHSLGKMKP